MTKSKDRQSVDAYTEKNLRKVLAGKGKVQGNFYFAGDTQGKDAALAVTLTSKDKKGAKALTDGKKLRKEIPGAKFGRGLVKAIPGKLVFELASGSASVSHIKLGFKKVLREEMALLKKALVVPLGGSADDIEEEDREALDAVRQDSDITEMNDQIGSFLSAEDAREELEEQLSEAVAEIEALSKPPVDEAALSAKKAELAALMDVGTDPFTGEAPPPAVQILVGLAVDRVLNNLHKGYTVGDSFEAAHNLQSEEHGRNTARAKALAARLISDGALAFKEDDTEAVDDVLSELALDDPKTPHTLHLIATLTALKTDKTLRDKLEAVGAPDPSMASFVRATLGLGPDAELTEAHARQAVFSAMLAEMRQGEAGSCFGTEVAIRVHDKKQGRFLDDMKSLVERGMLTRTVGGKQVDVPVSTGLYEGPVKKKLTIGTDGKVTTVDGTVLDASKDLGEIPELAAALSGLGIEPDDRQAALLAAVNAAAGDPRDEAVSLSAEKILEQVGLTKAGLDATDLALREENRQISQQIKALGAGLGKSVEGDAEIDRQIQALVERATPLVEVLQAKIDKLAAFDAGQELAKGTLLGQKDNRLLRSWEYTVSSMAERERSFGLMSELEGALGVATTDLDQDPDLVGDPSATVTEYDSRADIAFDLISKFEELFKANLTPGYDSSYSASGSTSDDGVSTGGGFVLYDKTGLDPSAWVPLRDEEAYKDTLAGLVRLAVVEKFYDAKPPDMSDTDAVDEYNQKLKAAREISERLQEKILTGDFVDTMTTELRDGLDEPEKVSPWAKEMGNNPLTMYKVYMEIDGSVEKEEETPADSEALTKWLTKTMKAVRDKASSTDGLTIPVGSTSHAFMLTPDHPDMQAAWDAPDPEAWAAEQMTAMKEASDGVNATAVDATMIHRIIDELPELRRNRAFLTNPETIDTIKTVDRLLEVLVGPAPEATDSDEEKRKYRIKAAQYGVAIMHNVKPPVESSTWLATAKDCLTALSVPDVDTLAGEVVTALGDEPKASQADLKKALASVLSAHTIEKTDDEIHAALTGKMPDMPSMIFADSNWGGGDHHIKFVMAANPVTGKVEMFRCNEDKTDFQPVTSAKDWTTGKWTMLTDPEQFD